MTKKAWKVPVVGDTVHFDQAEYGWPKEPDFKGTVLHHESEAPWFPEGHPKKGTDRFNRNLEWVDANHEITGRLTLDEGIHSGRSAKFVSWTHTDGRNFPMFIAELVKLVRTGDVEPGGGIEGLFKVVKRGQNYGIEYVS